MPKMTAGEGEEALSRPDGGVDLGRSPREALAHLLRSPRNAERLLLALGQARRGEGLEMSIEELRREVLGGEGDR